MTDEHPGGSRSNWKNWLSCLVLFSISGMAWGEMSFANEAAKEAWKSRMHQTIVQYRETADEKAIEELALYVFKLNRQSKGSDTDDLRIEATQALISIPGHARLYQRRLENLRSAVKKEPLFAFQYGKAQDELYEMLQYAQSAETVAVMGDLLNDPEGRNGKTILGGPISDGDEEMPINCQLASHTLAGLGIQSPPKAKPSSVGFEDVDAWKQWWDEIKSGKRTYRFVGSPVEYGPDGPVSAKDLSRREHDRQSNPRAGNVGTQEVASTPESLGIGSKVAAVVALALLAAGGWFAFGRRKGVV